MCQEKRSCRRRAGANSWTDDVQQTEPQSVVLIHKLRPLAHPYPVLHRRQCWTRLGSTSIIFTIHT